MLKVLRTKELVSSLGVLTVRLLTYQACAIYSVMIPLSLLYRYSAETGNVDAESEKRKETFLSLQPKQ